MDQGEEDESDCQYLAMLAETNESVDNYLPRDSDRKTATSTKSDSIEFREVFTMDAHATGALALHARKAHYGENRNARRRFRFESKGKLKAKPPLVGLPHRERCRRKKIGHTTLAETLPPGTVVPARKARSFPEGYASLGT